MEEYVKGIGQAVQMENGELLSNYLSIDKNTFTPSSSVNIEGCIQVFKNLPHVKAVVVPLLKCRRFLLSQQFIEAFEIQISAVIKFHDWFREGTGWLIPVLHTLTRDTRLIAIQADQYESKLKKTICHDHLKSAEQQLKKGFSLALNDRTMGPSSKKYGALYIVNELFKIYFQLNMIRLCRNLIKAVEGPGFPPFEQFCKRDKVTYQFYVGRIAMFEDDYEKAEGCLTYALHLCHKDYKKNMRLILQFLIPVKMLLGHLPTEALIAHYELIEFQYVSQAILSGNITMFNEALMTYQDAFIKKGIYLIMEKLRIITYRNLFKKIFGALKETRISLNAFTTGIQLAGEKDMSENEVQCILVNLIYNGYMKGYISHQQGMVVLSKKEPFPPVSKVGVK